MNTKMIRRAAFAVPMGVLLGVAGLAASGALSAPAGASATTPTTTSLTSSLNPSTYGSSVTFTAHVASTPPVTPPVPPPVTGTVTFSYNGAAISGCTSVTLIASQATCTTSTLPVGTDVVTAKYSGSATPSSGTVKQAVDKATPTITWANPAPITYPTALSGAQLDATASVAGTLTYSPPSGTVLPAGTQTLSVVFTPSTTTNYASTSATVALVVNPRPAIVTHTTVTASPNPSTAGATVTFTATVSPATAGGTVTFGGAGTSNCANEVLSPNHQATCKTSTLPVGTDVVTAFYSGQSTFDASSGSVTERVIAKTVTPKLPTVTSVTPSSGGAHDVVTITGTGFEPHMTIVYFGGRQAPHIDVVSGTEVTCWSPVRTGTVDVTVKTPMGTSAVNAADRFTYVPPTVTSVVPRGGGNRAFVTVTGTSFISGDTVRFGGKLAPHVDVVSANEITVDSPFGIPGASVYVTVRAPGTGTTSLVTPDDTFTYNA